MNRTVPMDERNTEPALTNGDKEGNVLMHGKPALRRIVTSEVVTEAGDRWGPHSALRPRTTRAPHDGPARTRCSCRTCNIDQVEEEFTPRDVPFLAFIFADAAFGIAVEPIHQQRGASAQPRIAPPCGVAILRHTVAAVVPLIVRGLRMLRGCAVAFGGEQRL